MTPPPHILIAGIGNIFLGDDGFGSEVAQRVMQRRLPDGVQVIDFGIRGFDLAFALLDGVDVAIFIDAAPRGGAPGTLYLLEHEPEPAPHIADPAHAPTIDAHAMDPVKVLRLAASMGEIPRKILIVGCEPTPFDESDDMRVGLSDPVHSAIDRAVDTIESLVAELNDHPPALTNVHSTV